MNVQLKDITVTARDGRVSHLDQVYIRGSHVRFFIVPDMLRCVHVSADYWASEACSADLVVCLVGMRRCLGRGASVEEVLVLREARRR